MDRSTIALTCISILMFLAQDLRDASAGSVPATVTVRCHCNVPGPCNITGPAAATFPAPATGRGTSSTLPGTILVPVQRHKSCPGTILVPVQRCNSCPRAILVPIQCHKSCPGTILVLFNVTNHAPEVSWNHQNDIDC